jgi:hypothetical protein
MNYVIIRFQRHGFSRTGVSTWWDAGKAAAHRPRRGFLILLDMWAMVRGHESRGPRPRGQRHPGRKAQHGGAVRYRHEIRPGRARILATGAALRPHRLAATRCAPLISVIGEESGGLGSLTTIVKAAADAAVVLGRQRACRCARCGPARSRFRLTVPGKALTRRCSTA